MVVHVGTSGWSYHHWDGVLYPPGARARERLGHYVQRFDTVELNSSFYRWPSPSRFAGWRTRLPSGFVVSVKAPRGLTHGKKLYSPEQWVTRIAAGWHELADKRAVLSVQLPPPQPRDDARLEHFLGPLPRWLPVAVEFRHPSWVHDDVFDLLARHETAYCVMSGAGLPCLLRATGSVVYVRMHGPDSHHLYGGSYPDVDLYWWADRVREWATTGKDVLVYFKTVTVTPSATRTRYGACSLTDIPTTAPNAPRRETKVGSEQMPDSAGQNGGLLGRVGPRSGHDQRY